MMRPRRALALVGLVAPAIAFAPLGARADDLWQSLQRDPALLGQELRALLLEEPELIEQGRAEARRRMAADAASDLAAEIAGDRATIADLAESLFNVTPRGFGAAEGPAGITLFTAARCADCLQAEAELRRLVEEMPGLRVERRSLSDSRADLLARALEEAQGPEAALAYRTALAEAPEADADAVLRQTGIDPESLPISDSLRADLAAEAALFSRLGLDASPSYVMPDRLIRGAMPGIVLKRYLSE